MDRNTTRRAALFAVVGVAVVAAAAGLGVWLASRGVDAPSRADAAAATAPRAGIPDAARRDGGLKGRKIPANQFVERADGTVVPLREAVAGKSSAAGDVAATDEAEAAAAWDALLDAFGAPLGRAVTPDDRARVNRGLKRLPPERRREAVQSLMNLVGDADFGVMGDVLFDGSQPAEVVEAVFNDLLNRPDEVKAPFLREIAQDEGHVGCAEARRIRDVQGLSAAGGR